MKSKKRISDKDLEAIIQSKANDLKDFGSDEVIFENLRNHFATEKNKQKKRTKISDADLEVIIEAKAGELKDYGDDETMFRNLHAHFSQKKTKIVCEDENKRAFQKVFKPKWVVVLSLVLVVAIAVPLLWAYLSGQNDYLNFDDLSKEPMTLSQLLEEVETVFEVNLAGYTTEFVAYVEPDGDVAGYVENIIATGSFIRVTVILDLRYSSGLDAHFIRIENEFIYKNVTIQERDNEGQASKLYRFAYQNKLVYIEIQNALHLTEDVLSQIIR